MARILVVDGSEPISRILGLLLEGAGHTTERATTGRAAIQALHLAPGLPVPPFDLVTLELSLPDADGRELLQTWREAPHCPPIVVVSMHTATMNEMDQSCAAAIVRKPFDVDELLHVITSTLQEQGATQ